LGDVRNKRAPPPWCPDVYVTLGFYLLYHKRKYDLIHVHQALHPAFVSIVIGKQLLNKPVIVKTASSGMTSDIMQLRGYPLGNFQLRHLVKQMEILVATAGQEEKNLTTLDFQNHRSNIFPMVWFYLRWEGQLRSSETGHHDSRLSKEKGIDVLLKAWVPVVAQKKDLELIILVTARSQGSLKSYVCLWE